MQKRNLPVGVFDSGVGGVSVLRELVRLLPHDDFLYMSDTKNAPYGTKSHEEISKHTIDCVEYMISRGIKALVVACNTATSVCIEELRERYPDMPIVGIEPALKPAVMCKEHPTVVVMATPLTLKEKKFAALCETYKEKANIIPLPCPGLMELIEKKHLSDKVVEKFLKKCFASVPYEHFDSVVLGCTHYPFVKDTILKLHPEAQIFDGGEGTAKQLQRLLEEQSLVDRHGKWGTICFTNTSGKGKKSRFACELLDME